MMASGFRAALIAFGVCAVLAPIVRAACLHFGAVDRPGPLKIHSRPTPRLGGIAVALAIAVAFVANSRPSRARVFFLAAFAAVWLIGVLDDLLGVPPLARLALQIAPGSLLWLGGWRFSCPLESTRSGIAGFLAVCVLAVAFVNSFNFLDGSDGVAAGVTAIVAASYLAISLSSFIHAPNPPAIPLAWSLLGACAAFLIFNFPPAGFFLGDSGSTILGFCVAFLALTPAHTSSAAPATLLPLMLAGLPLVDAFLSVIRRVLRRSSPFQGDRAHFYDLLRARGWSSRQIAFACYGLTAALSFFAWLGVPAGLRAFEVLSAFALAGVLFLALRLGSLQWGDRNEGKSGQQFAATDRGRSETFL